MCSLSALLAVASVVAPSAAPHPAVRFLEQEFNPPTQAPQGSTAPVEAGAGPATFQNEIYAGHRPTHALELAFSLESVWVAYRARFSRGRGYLTLGGLGNEDDDAAVLLRLMRFGEPQEDIPLGLGVGVGVYGVYLDQPSVDDIYALALSGYADYAIETAWPMRLVAEASFAPDLVTTSAADSLIDLLGRVELELSSFAGAYFGIRFLEVGLDGGGDREIDSSFHVGIRLWL